ncbi:alanine--tRNA ligase [Acetivibrio clariflavus]|uniref:Alanine--tRNA ligase n=1 Tax=Acetivibrio clariflavus (strain DSM 19732 / NBRC 101661 / EBR45) TaxID=720554 RepID=G8LSN5_ACECE|nr:alanine--tRNA ligase [Acetivibrio clariflavus]AEV69387.1 alanyl-tRNA synthetase [Acetivibrio clariflavus DSM 19732]
MQKLGLNELRERYLKFFEGKGHLRLPSFSLIPQNDPSLLLINSGMAPLKPYFTGKEEPPRRRVTTCQKCIRTPDIENVGKTARHGTFFEMLGNFSFGDYFKKEAIPWAWEFVTQELKMPVDRLWVSIYEEDDEAFEIWNKDVGVPAERIVRMGKKDNFWEHGTGPCGPCSEIYFDRGVEKGCGKPDCKVGCDCDRFIEFWNLVFTQFNKDEDGNYTRLPNPNIDTGMGLERLACIMQDVDNLFEVDTVRNVLDYVCKTAGVKYHESEKKDISIRVITDHIRSTTMMVSDGVIPSNEGRGYVLRRLLRRAARHGKLLGINKPFLYDIAMVVINESKEAYPELEEKRKYIQDVIKNEEEKFELTIDQGLIILSKYIEETKAKNSKTITGEMAFELHGTYGFPIDLTREIAEESGLSVDEEGFREEMEKHRKIAKEDYLKKQGSAWSDDIYSTLDKNIKTEFLGYSENAAEAKVMYIIKNDQVTESATEGDEVILILDRTPFYAESGGQVGDKGVIESEEVKIKVEDCKKTEDGKYLHYGVVEKGNVKVGASVKAAIDAKRRMAIARNHTTTHLLQKALKNVLGDHVHQAGSLVEPDRLRFDFAHFTAMTPEEIAKVEKEVNDKILESIMVETMELPIDEAKRLGATALFGEKYGSIVRVVKIGDYSMEFCGGTHLKATSQAGFIKIVSESGVAAGVRRIEALTGEAALAYLHDREKLISDISTALKTSPQDSVKRIESIMTELKNAQKEIEQLRSKLVSSSLDEVLSKAIDVNGVKVVKARFDQLDMEALRNTGDTIRNKLGSGLVVLGSGYEGKVSFVVMATKDVVSKGIHSGNIIREVAKIAGGGGGGRPDMAQAGGKDISKLDEALDYSVKVVEAQLK